MAGFIPVSSVADVLGMFKELISSSVTSEATSLGVSTLKEHVGYICDSNENVEKMKGVVNKLKTMRLAVKQQIKSAKRKGDDLVPGVKKWMKVVDTDISKAEGFLVRDVNRYRDGKRAAHMSDSLMDHLVLGMGYFCRASVDTPAHGRLGVYEKKNLDDILTQTSCLKDIIKAIKDKNKQIIGLYGMGGAGKTMLAMEVGVRMARRFEMVAFVTVSHKVDTSMGEIREVLAVVRKRLDKKEKVLVILDDVWMKRDLETLGISGLTKDENCKILLTSRNEELCDKMNVHKIRVNTLPKEEAWILFKRIVGDVDMENNADLEDVAKKVAEKCGGLPLLLKEVGDALKTKCIKDWENALSRIQRHDFKRLDSDIEKAFDDLQRSYDYLDEEAKLCFLLCCMFREDDKILLEDLVYYAVGLAKFHGLESMEDARERVKDAVKKLTLSGLLLNLEDERCTKMHDVFRDLALKIASKFCLVKAGEGLTSWLPRKEDLVSYTGISLMNNNICKLPNYELYSPDLESLLLSYNPKLATFSKKPFKGMKKVKVLDMAHCNQSMLRPLKPLKKLVELNFTGNIYLADIYKLWKKEYLQILILNNTGINKIPKKIGKLRDLRRLEALGCQYLNGVRKNVISNLKLLEELRIGFTPRIGNPLLDREIYESIVEVMKLAHLRYLDLVVPCFKVIPEDFDDGRLTRFGIQIGGFGFHVSDVSSHSDCRLAIEGVDVPTRLPEWAKKLIAKKPTIILDSVQNINNIIPDLSHSGFSNLDHIQLKRCDYITSLVGVAGGRKCLGDVKHLELRGLTSLEALGNSLDQHVDLGNLETLYMIDCPKLEKLFPVSVAQTLGKLQKLSIVGCENLKEVIWVGDDNNKDKIVFPSLTKISLQSLKKLERFSGHSSIKYPSLVDVSIMYCPKMKTWGPGTHEAPELKFDGTNATVNDIVAKINGGSPTTQESDDIYEDAEEDMMVESDEDTDDFTVAVAPRNDGTSDNTTVPIQKIFDRLRNVLR